MSSEFRGKNVAVIGLAATGLATARVLRDRGAASVRIYDSKPESALSAERVAEARALGEGVSLALGTSEIDWSRTNLVVPSPGVPRHAAPLVEAVRRGVPVLGEIEIAYRLSQAPILAITGTNGKTTTTALLGHICRAAGLAVWVAGNIAEDEGKRLPLIQAAVEAPEDGVIVAEISSFQLEWVEKFCPKVGAWLNVSNDHLDRHADFDEYARAKARLFAAQEAGNVAVLNADDENVRRYVRFIGGGRRWEFSLKGSVHTGTHLRDDGMLIACLPTETGECELMHSSEIPIPGRHNIANVLAASAMALAFDVHSDSIRQGVRSFKGVAHRMETVATINSVRYINNSMCTNPAAVAVSLEAVGTPLIAIVGGKHKGGDLGGMASSLKQWARRVVLIGEAAPVIADALCAAGMSDFERANDLPEAVRRAASSARSGETVILVPGCASFDMFSGFEHRGQVFREAVKGLNS